MVAMYRFGLVVLAGCSSYGLGVSQTSTVGRVEREAADMTIERRSGEFTLHGRRGPWFAFFDAGLGVFSVRQRSGGQAMETDELGLGIREAIGAGYRFERGPLWLTPFASFSGPMVMALVDVEEGGDFEQSELSGGLGVGVEVALARPGLSPFVRLAVEQTTGYAAGALAPFTPDDELSTLGPAVTIGFRATVSGGDR
jgi:hypothetical protein